LQPTLEFTSELLKDSPKESHTVTYAFSPLCFLPSKITSGYDFNWIANLNWQFQSPWLFAADTEPNSSGSLIILVVGLAVGAGIAFLVNFLMGKDAKSQSKRLLEQTKLDCENLVKSAEIEKKEALLQLQSKFDKENQKQRDELRKKESELDKRESALKQASDDLKKQERFVENNQRKLSEKIEDAQRKSDLYNKLIQQQQADLQRVTGMSKEEAQKQLLTVLERDLQSEMGSVILKHEKRVNETLQQKTQDILLTSMQRYASSQTAESTTSTVDIPNDEMKGRIIGREGRNIRAFEKISGCDLIIDDTPGVVIVSGFDPVRGNRESFDGETGHRWPDSPIANRGNRCRHRSPNRGLY
jgi:ribonucrease Y